MDTHWLAKNEIRACSSTSACPNPIWTTFQPGTRIGSKLGFGRFMACFYGPVGSFGLETGGFCSISTRKTTGNAWKRVGFTKSISRVTHSLLSQRNSAFSTSAHSVSAQPPINRICSCFHIEDIDFPLHTSCLAPEGSSESSRLAILSIE